MLNKVLSVFLLCVFFTACTSPKALYNKANYKGVVRMLNSKAKRGVLKNEDIALFEKSLSIELELEEEELHNSLASNNLEDWQDAYTSLADLEERQVQYQNYTQLNPENLYLIDIGSWDTKFADRLYNHHVLTFHELSDSFLATEDKSYAIDAYYELEKIAHFDRGEINTDSLLTEFAELGVRTCDIQYKDESFNLFELRHLRFYINPKDSEWSTFVSTGNADYTFKVILEDLDKNNRRAERQRQYSDDVLIDTQTTTDANGNEVNTPIFETYTAIVNEVVYTFAVRARVEVDVYRNMTSEKVSSTYFVDELYEEEVEAFILSGDLRAIPQNVNITQGSSTINTLNHDYSRLIEELLRALSYDAENYIHNF